MPAFEGPGDPVPLLFARPGQAPARRRIAGRATLAQTAGRLVGVLAPLPLGTEGRLSGWYRLGPESGPLPGDMRVGEVPADMPLHLHFVENRSVVMAVEVRTPVPVRMRLPLGTAVPLASVVDALTRLLQLPPGDWAASLDGLPLDGAAILADCTIEVDSQLVVAHP